MIPFDRRSVTVYYFPMSYAAIVLLLLLSSAPAWAVINITSLPFTCSIPGETYVVSSNLTLNSGDAITVTADNVVINGNGKTVTYAVTGAGYGVLINTAVTSIEIYNLILTQGGYDPAAGQRVHGIYSNGNLSGVKIHGNTISIAKTGAVGDAYGYGIYLSNIINTSTNNAIYSNAITITGTSAGRGISASTSGSGSFVGSIYNNTILLSNITSTPAGYPRAIEMDIRNSSTIEVYGNTINIDAGSSFAQGIGFGANNSIIRSNNISLAGINSRAIIIGGGFGNNEVYLNNITMTSQNPVDQYSSGIRLRYGADNNKIYRNTINAEAGINCIPIRYGESNYQGSANNNVFHHNILSSSSYVISVEQANTSTDFYANTITKVGGGYAIYIYGDPGQVVENLAFSYETIVGGTVRITGLAGGITGLVFCQSGIISSDVSVGGGPHDWAITSSNCRATPPVAP